MERKIGEIFEHNGDWYQVVECSEDNYPCIGCCGCKGVGGARINGGECNGNARNDGKFVVFKRLEKIGEPVVKEGRKFQCLNSHYTSCIGCVFYRVKESCDKDHYLDGPCPDNEFWVEIKQNRKNMEENVNDRTNCAQCGDKRFEVIARAKADLLKSTNIERDEKEMEVIDNILFRCAQMGWLEKYEKEVEKMDLKPFELQKAKDGKPVCTKDGRNVRIICFDCKDEAFPIVALVSGSSEKEEVISYDKDGFSTTRESKDILFMLTEKKEGWLNVYKEHLYKTKEDAVKAKHNMMTYINTIKISWEE